MSESTDDANADGIAIIGMAGRFPGAEDYREFWDNLVAGRESITFFSKEELTAAGVDVSAMGPSHVAARSILRDVAGFDAPFFGISARAAELMDPQHRLLLEAAYEALEDAGYAPDRMPGPVGVYVGSGPNTYFTECLLSRPELFEAFKGLAVQLGNGNDYVATRISHVLNLTGPSMTVQTACSTALVAVAQACQSLLFYQCDYALAGAAAVAFPQKLAQMHQEGGIYSADGHCRPFDAGATGTVFGDGVGLVALKRLSDALRDGDSIRAVIKGFALNNDGGDKSGYTAPSVRGQAAVVEMAQAMAGIAPDTIGYLEAHGTATPLGDPIEVRALSEAFAKGTDKKGFCRIGSVKGNIGHLDIAAGMPGLFKAALALSHRAIPASLHFESPNPRIDFTASPFVVADRHSEWEAPAGAPRRAGVSSFGIGGTNAHLVLEEAPARPPSALSGLPQLLILSARSAVAVGQATRRLASHWERHPELPLEETAYTLQEGRQRFKFSRAFVCSSREDALEQLKAATDEKPTVRERLSDNPPLVFMFPGQGAQKAGMGRDLYETRDAYRAAVDRCAEILQPQLGLDLREVLFPAPEKQAWADGLIGQTWITQPALFVTEYAMAQLWLQLGLRPSAMIGHSVGEYVAACLAGVFSLEDALRLIATRGRLIQDLPGGSMLAVRQTEEQARPLLGDDLSIAAINSPDLCVVSGPDPAIEALEQRLTEAGSFSRRLRTSHAFHSAMMEPAAARFAEVIKEVELRTPQIPYISNLSADWIRPEEVTRPDYWVRHIREAVRFAYGAAKLLEKPGYVYLEVGPGTTLTTLLRQQQGFTSGQLALSSMAGGSADASDTAAFLAALGRLWQAGSHVGWKALHESGTPRRVALPTYPFERKPYLVAPAAVAVAPSRPAPAEARRATTTPVSSNVARMAPTPMESSSSRLAEHVAKLLCQLSGASLDEIDFAVPLSDQGFDSLFLFMFSRKLGTEFGVQISVPQLVGKLSAIEELARHIDREAPAERGFNGAGSGTEDGQTEIGAVRSELQALSRQIESLNRAVFGSGRG